MKFKGKKNARKLTSMTGQKVNGPGVTTPKVELQRGSIKQQVVGLKTCRWVCTILIPKKQSRKKSITSTGKVRTGLQIMMTWYTVKMTPSISELAEQPAPGDRCRS